MNKLLHRTVGDIDFMGNLILSLQYMIYSSSAFPKMEYEGDPSSVQHQKKINYFILLVMVKVSRNSTSSCSTFTR